MDSQTDQFRRLPLESYWNCVIDALNGLYVADSSNSAVRYTSGGVVSTYSGQSTSGIMFEAGTALQLINPYRVIVDSSNNGISLANLVFVADYSNNQVHTATNSEDNVGFWARSANGQVDSN